MKGSMLASVSSGRDNSNYLGVLAASFLVCCVLASPITVAQTPATAAVTTSGENKAQPENATDVLAHAKELYSTEGPKAALPEFEKALALFRKQGDRKGEAIALGLIGNCYKKFGDFPKAEDYLQRALLIKRAIGD